MFGHDHGTAMTFVGSTWADLQLAVIDVPCWQIVCTHSLKAGAAPHDLILARDIKVSDDGCIVGVGHDRHAADLSSAKNMFCALLYL